MCCAERITLFVLIIVHVVGVFSETVTANDCKTPDNEQGICIDVRACDDLVTILRKQPLTDEDRNYLRSRQCGSSNGYPLVCCKSQHPLKYLTEGCGVFFNHQLFRGTDTYIDEYPWTALIEYEDSYNTSKFSCVGALINEDFVVIAAHCVNQSSAERLNLTISSVRLGEYNLANETDCEYDDCADPPQDIPIAEIIVHDDFKYNSLRIPENDIALIRLSQSAKLNDFVHPICLPIAERLQIDFANIDKAFEITGWYQNNSSATGKKSQLTFPYITLDRCNMLHGTDKINSKQLCTGTTYKKETICQGDTFILSSSAYPKVDDHLGFKHYLAGLFSFDADSCETDGRPVIYSNVTAHVDWILDHIRKEANSKP